MNWIPIENGVPPEGTAVLVSYASERTVKVNKRIIKVDIAFYKNRKFYAYGMPVSVSAWMPLPEPYKPYDVKYTPKHRRRDSERALKLMKYGVIKC